MVRGVAIPELVLTRVRLVPVAEDRSTGAEKFSLIVGLEGTLEVAPLPLICRDTNEKAPAGGGGCGAWLFLQESPIAVRIMNDKYLFMDERIKSRKLAGTASFLLYN
jgi:hypothetical protein